jgi:hypothetical protein
MWFALRPVELAFLDSAPRRWIVEARLCAPRTAVWDAFVDPSTWPHWFPGVRAASYPGASPPFGVGTRRAATVGSQRYEETLLAWEQGTRWAYRIDRATFPLAHAQLECTDFANDGSGHAFAGRWLQSRDWRCDSRRRSFRACSMVSSRAQRGNWIDSSRAHRSSHRADAIHATICSPSLVHRRARCTPAARRSTRLSGDMRARRNHVGLLSEDLDPATSGLGQLPADLGPHRTTLSGIRRTAEMLPLRPSVHRTCPGMAELPHVVRHRSIDPRLRRKQTDLR